MSWGNLFRETAVAPDWNSSRYAYWNGQAGNLREAGQWKRDNIDSRFPKGVGSLPWEWGIEVARDRNNWYNDSDKYNRLTSEWNARGQTEKSTQDEADTYAKNLRGQSLASYFGGSGLGSSGDSGYYNSKEAFGGQVSKEAMQNKWLENEVAKLRQGGLSYNNY